MIYNLTAPRYQGVVALAGFALAFLCTFILTATLQKLLPRDQGRAFAVNGAKSEGKPRGAGIIFVLVFGVIAALFLPLTLERGIYILLIVLSMLTGYLDDRSATPWKDYKKAALDLILAIAAAATYVYFNGTHIQLFFTDRIGFTMPVIPFVILAIILIWASINVTNCSDGVDGLSASLSIVSMLSMYALFFVKQQFASAGYLTTVVDMDSAHMILVFVMTLLAYLWFNASPSKLLMGDAGSRAMGFFLALMALKSGSPFLFLPICIVLIIDGGLGLIKVFLLRFLKIKILVNTRTPIHDHTRKNKGWSDTQTVFRFTIIQLVISAAVIGAAVVILTLSRIQ